VGTVSVAALESFHLGLESLRRGEFEQATTSLQKSIEHDPRFARAYLKLSEAYDGAGDYDRAAQTLEAGLRVVPAGAGRTRRLLLAQQALAQGELEKAIHLYQEFAREYRGDSEGLFHLALACEDAGDLAQAADALQKLIRIDPNHPQAHFHLGKDTILMGQADKAINQHLVKAISIHRSLNNRHGEADALNAMGVGYERLGEYDQAIKHYRESIELKQQIGNQKGTATSLSNIAKIYIFQGDHEKAKEHLTQAQSIFEELKDRKGIADTMNQFGVISEDRGQYTTALDHYKKALQIRKELGNDQLTAQSYDNIGHIYYLQGKYDDADVFWQQALSLRRSIGEESGVVLSLQNMGFLATAQGRLDDAVKSFMEALQQSRSIQYENAIAVSLGNLGSIHQMQGRYQAALESYQEAINVLEKLKDKKGIAEYSRMAGSVYLELNQIPQAVEKLNFALRNAEDTESAEIAADTRVLLARASRAQKDYATAETEIQLASAIVSKHDFEKIRSRVAIEDAWLRLERKEDTAGISQALKQAQEHRDPWLQLQALEFVATLELAENHAQKSAEVIDRALRIAKKLRSLPYLYRFHVLAASVHERLARGGAKAKQHQREASSALSEMKSLSPKLAVHL
jgi:tetratricopeptide (TPR) repeat protein